MSSLIGEEYKDLPLHIIGKNKWISSPIEIENLKRVAAAANSPSGEVGVSLFSYDVSKNILIDEIKRLNPKLSKANDDS